jgi:hypothetical protein
MKGTLVQQKVSNAINGKFLKIFTEAQKEEYDELAYTSIILHLFGEKSCKTRFYQKTLEKVGGFIFA